MVGLNAAVASDDTQVATVPIEPEDVPEEPIPHTEAPSDPETAPAGDPRHDRELLPV